MARRLSLIVDDDPAIRTFVRTILEAEQFEAVEADGGRAALAMAKALHGAIDLIITDVQMPDGDGLTFATAAKELLPSVPIIVISGVAKPTADFEFVEKPFTWETLVAAVRRVGAWRAAGMRN